MNVIVVKLIKFSDQLQQAASNFIKKLIRLMNIYNFKRRSYKCKIILLTFFHVSVIIMTKVVQKQVQVYTYC